MKTNRLYSKCRLLCAFFLAFLSLCANAQNGNITVKGIVKDNKGIPLPGVSIKVKGTVTGTLTSLEGDYKLNAPANSTLVFTFIGFATKEIPVHNLSVINVTLSDNNQSLSEVVVIGYGAQRKADVTSAVTTVKSTDFVTGPVSDAAELLKGKVAGLSVSSPSGDPNAQSQIMLRGNNSLYGNLGLLYIIDGVPGDLLTVAPEDIAEISVLKDGSSAAIYGVRGSNGVIIITTKRASGNAINQVDYNGNETYSQISREPALLTGDDYRRQIAGGTRQASYDLGSNTDWIKAMSNNFPVSHIHGLTFRGGNNQTNYLASLNYRYNQGIFLKSDHQQITGRVDINHSMLDGKLKFNLGLLQTNFNDHPFNVYDYEQQLKMNPTAPVRMPDGSFYQEPNNFEYQNPVSDIFNTDQPQTSFTSKYNATITFLPIEGLRFSAIGSYTKHGYLNRYFANFENISTIRDNQGGVADIQQGQSVDRYLNFSAEYSKAFGDHRLTLLGGYEYQDNNSFTTEMGNHNFPTDLFGYNAIQQGAALKAGNALMNSGQSLTNLISYIGRLTYNYKDKYLLLASLRVDGASQFYGASKPFGTFPAVQAGWRITKESFMQDQKIFDDLKFRAGYGVTGNPPRQSFLGVGLLGYGNYILYNGQFIQTLAPAQNANPGLRWEEKHETDLGLDYSLLKGLITGTFDVYQRKVTNLLYNFSVPSPPNLYPSTFANAGTMQNKGLEAVININAIRKTNFQWTTSFNFSTNSNKLISLSNDLYKATTPYFTTGNTGDPITTFTNIVQVGHNIGDFYGFKVTGVSPDGKWIYQEPDGTTKQYDQFNHSFNDKQVLGNGIPKYYAGWNNTLHYKDWDFGVTMRGAFGFQILNALRMNYENTSVTNYNRLKSSEDKVFGTAVLNKTVPLEFNSYYVENGNYWKIDNINLGYTWRKLKSKFVHNPRIYLSTLNTFTITKYKGLDPEVDRFGDTNGLAPGMESRDTYPTIRTYTIGLSASF
ncbi:SusC/RagA family TonB-linked outer membrane protein [Mucilaginibacter sabulilitoris]|uniref:SusC/RagA family TonB-linked outer membrane protein n=1 Tax=Mucilaginibacter sabulilitoris TaxID=1173583 RepID=A0ABZ0TGA9_9SPHI|nr:SusC/RagA family TonB-linked outer membrane protein [Mucilaginibacter sabulilitoris]WPU92219.1 SusC/RagA family TonB-linked outer membrane protein [Mucilaginibacter sabulilitoris]